MTDEHLLTAAKLRELVSGRLDRPHHLYEHVGLVDNDQDRGTLSFLEAMNPDLAELDGSPRTFAETSLGSIVTDTVTTDELTDAVQRGNSSVLSTAIGVTEQDLDASALTLPLRLLDQLENDGAPAFATIAGNPNTGKTNLGSLLIELQDLATDDLLVLSNSSTWERTDELVTGCHELARTLLANRETPKALLLDESSTHFDARTHRRDVAGQWTPLAKRFAKVGLDLVVQICHTGKDFHPEGKRLTTLAAWKEKRDQVEFFNEWPEDSTRPSDHLFGGSLHDLEPTGFEYDPDDAAPWRWDFDPEVLNADTDWNTILHLLEERGPVES
jgi:hypothetical protein